MHGRLKVRTTEEQKAQKHKEQQKKLAAYRLGMKQILTTRKPDEYDPNSLSISSQLLVVNPDIYTLWNYRKEVILIKIKQCERVEVEAESDLKQFLEDELKLIQQCLIANPKSYGSWYHRYWVLMKHPEPDWENEFSLCTKYLTTDDRNLHVWDYRRLIINKIGYTLPEEIKFTTERLNVNFSNYSSWHYRSTLRKLDSESAKEELTLVKNAVFTDPYDSSAFYYLRWILSNEAVTDDMKHELLQELKELRTVEEECKWICLAILWLHGSKPNKYSPNRENFKSYLTYLQECDYWRLGYYQYILGNIVNEKANY